MISTVHFSNVLWDYDDEDVVLDSDLPTDITAEIDIPECDSISDFLSDWLSEEYGYCHKGFSFTIEDEHRIFSKEKCWLCKGAGEFKSYCDDSDRRCSSCDGTGYVTEYIDKHKEE